MPEVPFIFRHKTKRLLNLKGTVAIVGNSDQLVAGNYGAEIDSHDIVFRFNLAPVAPQYYQSIGKKSDYYLLSQNITTHRFPHEGDTQDLFMKICRQSKVICYPDHEKNVLRYNKRPYFLGIEIFDINSVLQHYTGMPDIFSGNHHPRNGIKLIACLLAAGIVPDLYGFDMEARGDNSHYFDDEVQLEREDGGHLPSLEFKVLNILQEKGLVRII